MTTNASELPAIAETVQHYFDGMYRRDTDRLRKAFHPKACLFGHLQGKVVHLPAEEWFRMVESRPVPAESGEPYDMRIVATDVTGEVATVKVADHKAFHHD